MHLTSQQVISLRLGNVGDYEMHGKSDLSIQQFPSSFGDRILSNSIAPKLEPIAAIILYQSRLQKFFPLMLNLILYCGQRRRLSLAVLRISMQQSRLLHPIPKNIAVEFVVLSNVSILFFD